MCVAVCDAVYGLYLLDLDRPPEPAGRITQSKTFDRVGVRGFDSPCMFFLIKRLSCFRLINNNMATAKKKKNSSSHLYDETIGRGQMGKRLQVTAPILKPTRQCGWKNLKRKK